MGNIPKPMVTSWTIITGIVALVFVGFHLFFKWELLDSGTLTTIVIGAFVALGLRLKTNTGIQGFKCIAFLFMLLSLGLLMSGCFGNSNFVKVSGTGIFAKTMFGVVALGDIDASYTDIDAAQEIVTVYHTQYFDASADGLGDAIGAVGLSKKSEYVATISPVESGEEEARPP